MASPVVRDWERCFLCQKPEGNPSTLKGPSKAPCFIARPDELKKSYTVILDNVESLHTLGELPKFISVEGIIGEGASHKENLVTMMLDLGVVFHKKCKSSVDSQKVARAKCKRPIEEDPEEDDYQVDTSCSKSSPMKTRKKCKQDVSSLECFVCEKGFKDEKSMRRVSTFAVNDKVKKAAEKLGDSLLLSKISKAVDLMAMDAVYHTACLNKLYRKAENFDKPSDQSVCILNQQVDESQDKIAFNAIIEYLLGMRGSVELISLKSLRVIYHDHEKSMGYKSNVDSIHTTRLRARIIERLPEIKTIETKKGWYFYFNEDAHHAIKTAHLRISMF